MKPLFISPGPVSVASTRMRAVWVAKHMPGAGVVPIGELKNFAPAPKGSHLDRERPVNSGELRKITGLFDYDAYIFIKTADLELIRAFREQGKRVYWDVCDPAWWFAPQDCREVADLVDGVVASNERLAADFQSWYGPGKVVLSIPDRLEMDHFPLQRFQEYTDTVRLIWFGGAQNRVALFAALVNLERLVANGYRISLTICDDQPEQQWTITDALTFYYTRWSLAHENEILASHDIALLPPYPGPWGKVKSNNKYLTAWASGLAVSDGQDYETLESLVSSSVLRAENAAHGYEELISCYTADQSAAQWLEVLR